MTWRSLPYGANTERETRVFLALVAVYLRDGRATIRSVGAEAHVASSGDVLLLLRRLRDEGLCTWEPGKAGTLRPTIAIVVPRRAA